MHSEGHSGSIKSHGVPTFTDEDDKTPSASDLENSRPSFAGNDSKDRINSSHSDIELP